MLDVRFEFFPCQIFTQNIRNQTVVYDYSPAAKSSIFLHHFLVVVKVYFMTYVLEFTFRGIWTQTEKCSLIAILSRLHCLFLNQVFSPLIIWSIGLLDRYGIFLYSAILMGVISNFEWLYPCVASAFFLLLVQLQVFSVVNDGVIYTVWSRWLSHTFH